MDVCKDTVTALVGLGALPVSSREAGAMPDADYADLFAIPVDESWVAGPEASARAILEGTPAGRSAPRLWRALGLRLGPAGSPGHVQGWEIDDRGPSWIRLRTASWCMSARAVVGVEQAALSLALFVRFDRPPAALIWPPVAALHRRAVPTLLCQAVRPPKAMAASPRAGGRS